MNRTDRLIGIILALRGGRQTAGRLAARFEVSRRTILRDLDALGQIGVPVVAMPGAGGGFALMDDYWLPPLHLSVEEATLALLAIEGVGSAADSPFGQARRTVEEKLRAALRPAVLAEAERDLGALSIMPPRSMAEPFQAHFMLLRDAIRGRTWARVEYQSLRRTASHRLLPRRLHARDGRWYLSAVSLDAGEERTYRLDRIVALTPIAPPEGADAAIRAASAPRPDYADPGHPEIVARLTYAALRRAEDRLPSCDEARRIDPDTWELRFRCPQAELAYYAREIHALGPEAEAIAPGELRALVRSLAVDTAARYARDPDSDSKR